MNTLKKTAVIAITSFMLSTACADMMDFIKETHDKYVSLSATHLENTKSYVPILELLSSIDSRITVKGVSITEPETLELNLTTMTSELTNNIINNAKDKWPHVILKATNVVSRDRISKLFSLYEGRYPANNSDAPFYTNETSIKEAVLHVLNAAVFSYNVSETFSDTSLTIIQKVRDTYNSFADMNMIDLALKTTNKNHPAMQRIVQTIPEKALLLFPWVNVGSRLFIDPVHIEKCSNEECSFKNTVQTYMPWRMKLEQRQEFVSLLAKTIMFNRTFSFFPFYYLY